MKTIDAIFKLTNLSWECCEIYNSLGLEELERSKAYRREKRLRNALFSRIEKGDKAIEALKQVEWVRTADNEWDYCPWCSRIKHVRDHASDCHRQIALGIK